MACLQFLLFWSITINFLCVYGNDDAVGGLTLNNVLTTFKDMQAKLDKLETSERNLKQTVSILVGKTEQLRAHVGRLETSEARLKQTVKTLCKTTAKLQQHIAKLTKTEEVSEHPRKEDTLKKQPEEFPANTSNSVEETTRTFSKKRQILNDCRKRGKYVKSKLIHKKSSCCHNMK
jgi:predicted nuclease with TOPRIM domain